MAQAQQQTSRSDYWSGVFEVRKRTCHELFPDTFEEFTEVDLDREGAIGGNTHGG